MKFKLFLLVVVLSTTKLAYAQAPFTTLVKEPVIVQKKEGKFIMYDIEAKNSKNLNALLQENDSLSKPTNKVGFFKNSTLALNILNKSDNRTSINAQVLFYKINMFTPIDSVPKNYKYNIPVMVISKLSTSYDSISGASALDVLDYEAAPITLRVMPSWKLSKNTTYKEQLLFGFYADARAINIQNTQTNDYSLEVVGSAGIGFTFTGEGEAGFYNEGGNYEAGNWLVSAMFQGAIGDKEVIQSLFNTDKSMVTSFQSYFAFNISEGSKFNLKIGYQHFFKETIAGTKNTFSIALGI